MLRTFSAQFFWLERGTGKFNCSALSLIVFTGPAALIVRQTFVTFLDDEQFDEFNGGQVDDLLRQHTLAENRRKRQSGK